MASDRQSVASSAAPTTADRLRPTIFHEDWWLDAVAPGAWQALTVRENERDVARWPIFLSKRWGMPIIELPPLTYALGPAIDDGSGSVNTRMLRRLDLTEALIAQLPTTDHLGICLHEGIGDVTAFQGARLDTSVQFTVAIAPAPEEQLWRGLRDKTRNVIRRSQERHTVIGIDDPEQFVQFYRGNLAARNLSSYFDLDRVNAIHRAGRARGQVQIIGVNDATGELAGATLIASDATRSYHLLSTRRADSQDNGLTSLMVWEAMRQTAATGRTFDFDGIASLGSARFYAGFGGQTAPRYIVRRSSQRFCALQTIRRWLKGDDRNYFQRWF